MTAPRSCTGIFGAADEGKTTVNNNRFRIRIKLPIKNAAELYQHAANWVREQAN